MYPSVTRVLKPFQDFSFIPGGVLEAAKVRGIIVHRYSAAIAKGLWYPPPPEEYAGYVKSFKDWFEAVVVAVHLVEVRLVCESFGFTGRPDLVLTIRGDELPSLWDIKTPAVGSPAWLAQVAGYKHLAEVAGLPIGRAGALRLDKNGGRAKLDEYTKELPRGLKGFLNCLGAYHFFNKAA